MRRSLPFLIGLLVVATVTVGIWYQTRPPHHKQLRIGFNTWVGYGPLFVAQKREFFKRRNLDVELHIIEGTGERRSALIAGRLDGAGSTIDDTIVTAAQGAPVRMVLALDQSDGADGILANSSIHRIEDLRGQSVAVQPGFVNHFFLLYVLKQAGLTSHDVKIIPMEPDKAGAAFVGHNIDVAVTWEPYLSQVKRSRPDGDVLVTSHNYPGVIVDTLIFRDDILRDRAGDVRAFIDAWYEAVEYVRNKPADASQIIGDALHTAPAEVTTMLKGVRLMGKADNKEFLDPQHTPNAFAIGTLAVQLWKEEGFVKTDVDVGRVIDSSYASGSQK